MADRAVFRHALALAAQGDWSVLATALGMEAAPAPVDFLADPASAIRSRLEGAAGRLHRVGAYERGGARAALWVAAIPEWGDRPSERERIRRRIAKALVELAPAGDRNVLVVLTCEGVDDIELVLPRQRTNRQLGTVRAIVSRTNPNRHHLELLEALVLKPGMGTAAITRQWNDAFSVERVTDAFYKEFRLLRDRFVKALAEANPGHPLLDPAKDDDVAQAEVRRFVTRNLGRVLFLWFIQAKGWLDSDTSYLVNLYGRSAADHRSFFTDALLPLFFDTLAVEPARRNERARALGDVPYLNGGLFVPTAVEDRLYGDNRQHVDIVVPNELFDPRTHDSKRPTLLGLLASYRFTTQESTPDDLSVDPDPELLGKVFENLNEDRKKTGTFYTPREVVRFMCREALDGYLVEKTGIGRETLAQLRLEAIDPAATDVHLTPEERKRLEEALLSVTVCDPAVGSGAFPVGMLQEIVQLLIGIEQSADVKVQIGGQKVAEWKEAVITNCLYGVDINPEAVEICQLRLWLSMVVDAERPVPLPNLDFRFEAGDSLVDRIGETRLRETLPREGHQDAMLFDDLAEIEQRLEALRAEYATVRDSVRARELRREIKATQLELVRRQISDQLAGVERSLIDTKARLDKLKRMGAGARDMKREEKAAARLVERHEQLRVVLDGLSPDAPYKKPFLWPVEFPEVFEHGGFDIVIANPPYVRQEKLAAMDQETYALSFAEVHSGKADLLVYFFARALQIMRDGGRIAFITSNKFHRAAYGEGLRAFLPAKLQVEHVIDFGDLSVFAAIAYPSVLIGRKATPDAEAPVSVARLAQPVRRALAEADASESVSSVREQLENLDAFLERNRIDGFPQALLRRDGWVLEDPRLVRLFDRVMAMGTPLGEFVQGRMYYGIKTGLNEAFVIDEAKRAELIAADPKSAELIKPWLRGRDIKRWKPEWAGLYGIIIASSSSAASTHPWKYASNEMEAEECFARHYPAIHAHLSAFEEGLRARISRGRWWWELPSANYYKEFEQPKLVFTKFLSEPRFSYDLSGSFVNNACGFIAAAPAWLAAFAQSRVFWLLLALRLTDLQGGYYQIMNADFEAVSIPGFSERQQEELGAIAAQALDAERTEASTARVDDYVRQELAIDADEWRLLCDWYDRSVLGRASIVEED
ncbi:MAG: N-6 DNA methylase [Anaerosomatales bacterium]|nr:N-6 DNA methylase [Anaerosomatales bacterium]